LNSPQSGLKYIYAHSRDCLAWPRHLILHGPHLRAPLGLIFQFKEVVGEECLGQWQV